MSNPISSGDTVYISQDIIIEGQTAFTRGQSVVVESISPNPSRPEYKYVIYSPYLKKRLQLSDNDVFPAVVAEQVPSVPPPVPTTMIEQQPLMPPDGHQPAPQQSVSPQTLPRPKKSEGKGKWILLGAGILVVLIIIAAVAISGKKSEQKPAENKAGTSTPSTQPPVTETKKGVYAVGETANVDKLAITVYRSFSTFSSSPDDGLVIPEHGKKFLVADIGFTNNDTKPRELDSSNHTWVHTPDGMNYTVSLDYSPKPWLAPYEIAPGQTARGYVCFDVPENIGPCSIIFDTSPVTGGDTFEVKLQ